MDFLNNFNNTLWQFFYLDLNSSIKGIISIFGLSSYNLFLENFLDVICASSIHYNHGYLLLNLTDTNFFLNTYNFLNFLNKFIKLNLFLFIIYTIFFITYLENYIKQIKILNNLAKIFILNENEKEIGPVDDFFFLLFYLF